MDPTAEVKKTHLMEGDMAPVFTVSDQHNRSQRLIDYRGKFVLLYFYPEDDTSG